MTETPRNVLVTGASRGLGLGIARKLTSVGYQVIAVARQKSKYVTEAIAEAKHGNHAPLHFEPFDLGKIEGIPDLVKKVRREFGPLYGLINNAAVGHDGALALMPNGQIEQLVRLNTLSPMVLSKYVVRSMMSERAGRIVNVASIIGFTGYSGLSVYAATKASMLGFTRSLAREVGRLGITVNAVAPGWFPTDMSAVVIERNKEYFLSRIPLGRFGSDDDLKGAAVFLSSDASNYVTGQILAVDGGQTA